MKGELKREGHVVIPSSVRGPAIDVDLGLPYRDRDRLIEAYWQQHPRFAFFKSLRAGSQLLDVGAGSGSLCGWKTWGPPDRSDLQMYAVDRAYGEHFENYVDYDIVDIEEGETKYLDSSFDAMIASHIIDYLVDCRTLAREVARLARPGAKLYVEWASAHSAQVPGREALARLGIPCGTIRFDDDGDHVAPLAESAATEIFETMGLRVVTQSVITNDYLLPELIRFGVREQDSEIATYGLWLAYKLARYVVLEKPARNT